MKTLKNRLLGQTNKIISVVVLLILFYNVITLPLNINPTTITNTIITLFIFIVSLFYKTKTIFICTLTVSLYLSFVSEYGELSSFFFCLMSIGMYKRYKIHILVLYFITLSVGFTYNGFVLGSCINHVLGCIVCYFLHNMIFKKSEPVILNLTDQEKYILEQLSTGKQQKEIDKYSQNTVSKYLQRAKLRNNINTTAELLQKYVHST